MHSLTRSCPLLISQSGPRQRCHSEWHCGDCARGCASIARSMTSEQVCLGYLLHGRLSSYYKVYARDCSHEDVSELMSKNTRTEIVVDNIHINNTYELVG